MAEVHFRGTITNDPALAFTPQGTPSLKLRVAENHSFYDKDRQEWKQTGTTWRDLTFWGKKAEELDGAFRKNDWVAVSGKEESREWETKTGEKRTSLGMRDPLVGIIPKPNRDGQGNQQQGGFQQSNQQNGNYNGQQPPAQPPAADPWGAQSGGNYNWGAPEDEEPPF
ncbi:single-stranded DNA-binding protein [Rothia amarae]|uniref:single-stranded DNA-binding protein n=1 Tax=Rothia amarae TaxID=169480 RepID=UPI0031D16A6F